MSIVTTSITNAQWNDLKIEFKGKDTKVYFKGKEIKKIMSITINACEVILEHALLDDTYDILGIKRSDEE